MKEEDQKKGQAWEKEGTNEENNKEYFKDLLVELDDTLRQIIAFKILEHECTLEESASFVSKGCQASIEATIEYIKERSK